MSISEFKTDDLRSRIFALESMIAALHEVNESKQKVIDAQRKIIEDLIHKAALEAEIRYQTKVGRLKGVAS